MARNNQLIGQEYEAEEIEGDNSAWAISYSDMISVLLCFFVILLSISVINPNKFESIKRTVEGAIADKTSIEILEKKLEEFLKGEELNDSVQLSKNELGVDISIRDALIFASGSADVSDNSRELFSRLLSVFADLPAAYNFEIEGHTDDLPINNEEYPSNWYLSTDRALTVLDLFISSGYNEKRFQVQGFADTQPAFPNFDKNRRGLPENRAKNRRVIIKVR